MATFFIVGSTVKLAILARKDEVEIMQLVGASEAMIQAPFVVEGMLQGLIGGSLSILALWAVFQLLCNQIPVFGLFGSVNQFQFLAVPNIALILAIGWLLGTAGSVFSLRRFTKTWKA
jgi:cell division transport system permease protein